MREVRKADRGAYVAIEANYGWYWVAVVLRAAKFEVHLAHPYGMKAMRKRNRVQTDAKDAYELANLLRMGSLPQGYIAHEELRELRELVRHRRQLTKSATSVKAQIRALLAKHGFRLPASCLESQAGQDQLDLVVLPECPASRLEARRRLMMMLDNEIDALDAELDRRLKSNDGYRNLLKVRASVRSWRRSSSSRSATSPGSALPSSWPAWPGSRRGTTSRTVWCAAVTSARKAALWSAGPRSNPQDASQGSGSARAVPASGSDVPFVTALFARV